MGDTQFLQQQINAINAEVNQIKLNAKDISELPVLPLPLESSDAAAITRSGTTYKINANEFGGSGGGTGDGDMKKVIYDTNGNSVVDDADNKSLVAGALVSDALNNLNKQINPPSISNFNFAGRPSNGLVEAGAAFSNLVFVWNNINSPITLVIGDSKSMMSTLHITDGHNTIAGNTLYQFNNDIVTWIITGNDGVSDSCSLRWVEPSYFGTNTDGSTPSPGDIIAESKIITYTASQITVKPNNSPTEHVWIAVPVTGSAFTKWFNVVGNDGNIGTGEAFEKRTSTMDINGVTYEVYVQTLPSAWNGTLKLF